MLHPDDNQLQTQQDRFSIVCAVVRTESNSSGAGALMLLANPTAVSRRSASRVTACPARNVRGGSAGDAAVNRRVRIMSRPKVTQAGHDLDMYWTVEWSGARHSGG